MLKINKIKFLTLLATTAFVSSAYGMEGSKSSDDSLRTDGTHTVSVRHDTQLDTSQIEGQPSSSLLATQRAAEEAEREKKKLAEQRAKEEALKKAAEEESRRKAEAALEEQRKQLAAQQAALALQQQQMQQQMLAQQQLMQQMLVQQQQLLAQQQAQATTAAAASTSTSAPTPQAPESKGNSVGHVVANALGSDLRGGRSKARVARNINEIGQDAANKGQQVFNKFGKLFK